MKHKLYFWREEGPIPPAADSLVLRLAEDRNLPGVVPLSLATIKGAFSHHFPGITVADAGMEWRGCGIPFQVLFNFDERNQPKSVCVSSQTPLVGTPEVFDRIIAVTREIGCTRIESRLE